MADGEKETVAQYFESRRGQEKTPAVFDRWAIPWQGVAHVRSTLNPHLEANGFSIQEEASLSCLLMG